MGLEAESLYSEFHGTQEGSIVGALSLTAIKGVR
jgi:hypothetical protein